MPANAPRAATASMLPERATALLIPEARPESSSGAACITAVESGDTRTDIPKPISARNGKVTLHIIISGAVSARPIKATPTIAAPAVRNSRGPRASASRPILPDSVPMKTESGSIMRLAFHSGAPHALTSVIGTKNRVAPKAKNRIAV